MGLMLKKSWMVVLGLTVVCAGILFAAEIPVGKKVQIQLKTGNKIEGVIKEVNKDQTEITLVNFKEPIELSAIQKIVILKDQSAVRIEEEGDGRKTTGAMHRLSPISIAFGGSGSFGLELVGYEYIGKSGLALRVTPLSIYGFTEDKHGTFRYGNTTYHTTYTNTSAYWAPLWFRGYARKMSENFWPYAGATLAYHAYETDLGETLRDTSIRPAVEYGFDFGGKTVRGNIGGKTFFGEGGDDKTITLFSLGLSIGWEVYSN
ncbi:MAG: hypothetical protein IPN19_01985 [Elusimicrobia bacterium]|nr:hypothetical protein [Elusimicrobiota bacterium]